MSNITPTFLYVYTVNRKKRWQHICDHGKTRSIFIIFAQL